MSTELSLQNEGTCEMRYSYAFGFKVYLYEKCSGLLFNISPQFVVLVDL